VLHSDHENSDLALTTYKLYSWGALNFDNDDDDDDDDELGCPQLPRLTAALQLLMHS
jgi:hypothetical protein